VSGFARRTPALHLGGLPRVDLLPPSEMRRREVRTRIRLWAWVAFVALAISIAAVGGAVAFHMSAALSLSAEQARTQQILTGIAGLSEVSAARSVRTELSRTQEEAMAGDLDWTPVLAVVGARLPADVVVQDYVLEAGPIPLEGVAAADATGATGTVTVASPNPISHVELTRALRDVATVRTIEVEELAREDDDPVYEYRMRLVVDQTFYTGAFTADAEEAE
jgi:hypothetical protein